MSSHFIFPFDVHTLLRKKKAIRRDLLKKSDFLEKRIAILGGSSTPEVRDMIELFLLSEGIKPVFYESEYNRYYEDVMFPNEVLKNFAPDVIYIHTSGVNIIQYPSIHENREDIEKRLSSEVNRYQAMWDRIAEEYSCPIIQNNFELPHSRSIGNLDAYDIHGRTSFIAEINHRFCERARERHNLYLNDINYLSAWIGLERWYDKFFWYSYKYAMSYEAIPLLAHSVASIIHAIFGKAKKCLVLDLDNTLWGGVIGDDGLHGIRIGKETSESEAYTEFQEYVKSLKERGIVLAVCSKNDETNARDGFSHPDSLLSIEDFAVFRANWEPKPENIREIARSLNLGIDSLVFVDDNPVERALVRAQEPLVAVPEIGSNVVKYIDILDKTGYFETVSLSADDLKRSTFYAENTNRQEVQSRFENYDEFLQSLEMVAEIKPFAPVYLDRITQLTNKSNQFNVTTRRYTYVEIESLSENSLFITLYGRLRDKFGDNGLVSVMIGAIKGPELHIDLWLMSCRVLKRGMEAAMLNQLVAKAQERGVKTIYGYYYPTAKNGMVSWLFKEMGFKSVITDEKGNTVWGLDISAGYDKKIQFIEVNV